MGTRNCLDRIFIFGWTVPLRKGQHIHHRFFKEIPENPVTWTWLLFSPHSWVTERPSGLNGVNLTRKDCNMLRGKGFMEVGGEGQITLPALDCPELRLVPGCQRHGSRTWERPVIIWRPFGACASVYVHDSAIHWKQVHVCEWVSAVLITVDFKFVLIKWLLGKSFRLILILHTLKRSYTSFIYFIIFSVSYLV